MNVSIYKDQFHNIRPDGVEMTDFFDSMKNLPGGEGVKMGYGVFPPNMEAPPAAHEEDEYSFVISGTIKVKINGKVYTAEAGTATFIPAGEEHISFNDGTEECRLVWMLVKR